MLPALLWLEWVFGNKEWESGEADEDIAAIDVALLAAFQQDFNISPLPSSIRVVAMNQPSIYHVLNRREKSDNNTI